MSENYDIPPINTELLDNIMARYNRWKDKLGLRVHVHNPERVAEGDIFLYNHFARFETVIPHYVNHQMAGAYTRTIADHGLFKITPKLTKFLLETGTVPNNQEGLLPYLAAEILRGRKVVIFPEGGMVKSRKVFDNNGNYSVWSGKANAFRKHHKGAAVLALTLDLFKQRIRGLFQDDDQPRLEHWRHALGFTTLDDLRAAADRPTKIMPANITFYPIRISDNFISKTLKRFKKNAPETLIEEAIIEGNLIFKNTDMNIHYNAPIETTKQLNWAEEALLKRHFINNVKSLDELFSIQKTAKTWPEKFLSRFLTRETDTIRDKYMAGLYQGITINLSHIASRLITTLYEDGVRSISRTAFCKMLYLSIKYVQDKHGVNTHDSIAFPAHYNELLSGRTPNLKSYINMCVKAELLEKTTTDGIPSYTFTDKISDDHHRNAIRRNNPIQVYANESEPTTAVSQAVDDAIATYKKIPDSQMADYLFDDELKDFAHQQEVYAQFKAPEKYTHDPIDPKHGEPYFLLPPESDASRVGVILTHGFLGAPCQLRAFGEHLNRQGHAVVGVRLPGHGTTMHDMQTRTKTEWVNSVKTAYDILAPNCDKIILIGFSTGALVNALMAADAAKNIEKYSKLAGITFVAAPMGVQDKNMHILPLIHGLNTLARRVPFFKKPLLPFYKYHPKNPHFQYPFMPVNAINELRKTINASTSSFKKITLPALILQAKVDPTVKPVSAQKIHDRLASTNKNLHWLDADQHDLIGQNIGATWQLIEDFIDSVRP